MKTKTEEIFELTAPYNNEYQGTDPRVLFVCSAGLLRSATAANLFAKKGWNTRGCGSEEYALIPISFNLIAWADRIYFVNSYNYKNTLSKFEAHAETEGAVRLLKKKSKVLDIEDSYDYNNPKLIKILEKQIEEDLETPEGKVLKR